MQIIITQVDKKLRERGMSFLGYSNNEDILLVKPKSNNNQKYYIYRNVTSTLGAMPSKICDIEDATLTQIREKYGYKKKNSHSSDDVIDFSAFNNEYLVIKTDNGLRPR